MWQARAALLRQRKLRAKAKASDEAKLPRRWTELILWLNDMEHSKEQDAKTEAALPSARQAHDRMRAPVGS